MNEKIRILRDGDWITMEQHFGSRGPYRSKWLYRPDLPEWDYFGVCPKCWSQDDVLTSDGHLDTTDGSHWYVCHRHKVKWFIGSNLFSSWKSVPEDQLRVNEYRLVHYHAVEQVRDFRHRAGYQELLAGVAEKFETEAPHG